MLIWQAWSLMPELIILPWSLALDSEGGTYWKGVHERSSVLQHCWSAQVLTTVQARASGILVGWINLAVHTGTRAREMNWCHRPQQTAFLGSSTFVLNRVWRPLTSLIKDNEHVYPWDQKALVAGATWSLNDNSPSLAHWRDAAGAKPICRPFWAALRRFAFSVQHRWLSRRSLKVTLRYVGI